MPFLPGEVLATPLSVKCPPLLLLFGFTFQCTNVWIEIKILGKTVEQLLLSCDQFSLPISGHDRHVVQDLLALAESVKLDRSWSKSGCREWPVGRSLSLGGHSDILVFSLKPRRSNQTQRKQEMTKICHTISLRKPCPKLSVVLGNIFSCSLVAKRRSMSESWSKLGMSISYQDACRTVASSLQSSGSGTRFSSAVSWYAASRVAYDNFCWYCSLLVKKPISPENRTDTTVDLEKLPRSPTRILCCAGQICSAGL